MTQFADITQLGYLQNEQPICQEHGQMTSTSSINMHNQQACSTQQANEGDRRRPSGIPSQSVSQNLQEDATDETQAKQDTRPGGISDQHNQDTMRPGGEQHQMQNDNGNQTSS